MTAKIKEKSMRRPYIHEWFSEKAKQHSDWVAIDTADEQFSYRDLHDHANSLANDLRAAGMVKGNSVVIFTEDRKLVISAVLAVLKAGGVFIPLSTEVPDNRLSILLSQASPTWIITEDRFKDRLSRLVQHCGREFKTILVTETLSRHSSIKTSRSAKELADHGRELWQPDDLAYVFFTSGSTGIPKGIDGRLRAIEHYIRWEIETFKIAPGTRVSQLVAPSFDAILRDIFVPLCSGGTICIPPGKEILLDGARLASWIQEQEINLVHCVPSLFRLFVDHWSVPDRQALKHLLLAGEPLFPSDVKKWISKIGSHVQLVNLYGPSETTMTKLFYIVQPSDQNRRSVPIGKPMTGASVLLLDEYNNVCLPGMIGEIHIRTPFRSLGYHKQPELTGRVFVRNSFTSDPRDILYKTGDLARVLEDGDFEFLGRRDDQLKIRGIRIEPGEIESTLRFSNLVRDCVVVDREDASGEKFLCAYLVLEAGGTTALVREFLSAHLPDHLVPRAFVVLEKLPLTVNGKLDRKTLPEPDTQGSVERGRGSFTPIEEIICGIWKQVLRRQSVGVDENFFELGGHSLLVIQVIASLRKIFQQDLSLMTLFETPTVKGLARKIEELMERGEQTTAPPIVSARREGHLPLSFAQQRLWFMEQLDPGSATYNIPAAVRLKGPLDERALRRSIDEVVRRHEVLRTLFPVRESRPVQQVQPAAEVELPVIDLSEMEGEQRQEQARRLVEEESRRGFDLSQGPLLRALLVKLDEEEHVLVVTMHHIVSDGWSTGILVKEFSQLYEAYSRGEESPLEELKLQYADFAVWQREWLQAEVLEQQLSYWRQQLGGLEVLELPTDRVRPKVASHRGHSLSVELSEELTKGLRELSQREGVTLFMTLLAAFQALLHRYSGQEDIAVGVPVANRNQVEIENLIGFFVNTLVMRTDLGGVPSFKELVGRVRKVALEAYTYQGVPFEKLVEEIKPERDLSRAPLFQVMFVLQNTPIEDLRLKDVAVMSVDSENRMAKFDLTLVAMETERGLLISMEYSTDLFSEDAIRRMLGCYEVLLEAALANTEQRISELPLLTKEDKYRLLTQWNETETEYGETRLVHEVIAEQASRRKDAIAIKSEQGELSYGELDHRANQLAHYLKELGVGPEVRVGISMERGSEMMVGLLGVLKAGGAYLPLDPTYPQERLSYMLQDAGIAVLLTQERLLERLPSCAVSVLCIDADWPSISRQSAKNLTPAALPENSAYVIYTSGSTGRPKAVVNIHSAIRNRLLWMQNEYRLTDGDRVLQKTPFIFDVSVWEFLWPLMTGATLVMARPGGHQDPAYLVRSIVEERITRMHFVPSMLRAFLEQEGVEQCVSLRDVFCSGEALSWELQERFFMRSQARLHNLYGPTEAAIEVTYWECERGCLHSIVPIGRPIANTQIYLLDQHMQPVAIGTEGELHIGGVGLARGYHARPDLTAERFVPVPFDGKTGARLYKTGDRVRYLPDGNLEFLGRMDNQLKIRGVRIELGEIEAVLRKHPDVIEAVVVAREGNEHDQRLVAYLIGREGMPPNHAELRSFLKERLPEYMVPNAFVWLEKLPVTANGKLDRKALPESDRSVIDQQRERRTPVEDIICGLWAQMLQVEQIGIDDNFFELGGHSLLATQIVLRIREVLSVELSVMTLFEAPTVKGLARKIEELMERGEQTTAPPIVRAQRTRDLPLSYAQQRLWFMEQLDPGSATYNTPAAVRLKGQLDEIALRQSINEVVRRHEVLRTVFPAREGNPVQEVRRAGEVELPVIGLSSMEREEGQEQAKLVVEKEARRGFDLSEGPLLRALLVKLGEEEHVLMVTMHHIVSDGWSTGILVKEFSQLYEAYHQGEESGLEELELQYVDFAIWQREWLQGEVLEEQLSYWRQQLRGLEVLELPTDRVRPRVASHQGRSVNFEISEDLTKGLRELSQREGVTLFMTLLAAFQALLHRYSGQSDVAVGTDIANRDQIEIEGLMGFFVNQLVMRTDLGGNPSFRDLLQRVRTIALGGYAHQNLPFERIVEDLALERDMSRGPLFQVKLVLENQPQQDLELYGLKLESLESSSEAIKLDLNLVVKEGTNQLRGILHYAVDLFDRPRAERILEHWQLILEQMVADAKQRIDEVELLVGRERRLLLTEWNVAETQYGGAECVHQLIEEETRQNPDAIAVVYEDQQMTYRELNRRANQLAHHLWEIGVRPEARVAVFMEKNLELVIGLYGVLKVGGAYVPMDTSHPLERLSYMLEDAQVPVLLTSEALKLKLPAQCLQIVTLDQGNVEIERQSCEDLELETPAENLAYVIYTSGSTGQPKGVEIEHRQLTNYVRAVGEKMGMKRGWRMALVSTVAADLGNTVLFPALCGGGRLYVISAERATDAPGMRDYFEQEQIECIKITPSHLGALLSVEGGEAVVPAELLVLGGEASAWDWIRRVQTLKPQCRILNHYGPTECTVGVVTEELEGWTEGKGLGMVALGKPLNNTHVYVRDRQGQPVPIGISGELHVGGKGIGRGYLNHADFTADRFIPDSLSGESGGRLYRTGDLVRWAESGSLEFLGRIDDQVKIRGFRVELGEIETLISRHEAVEQCAAVVVSEENGEKWLVCYVVGKAGREINSRELIEYLQGRIPNYMVPSAIMILEKLPLTANGKLDRRTLLTIEPYKQQKRSGLLPPRDNAELFMKGIWEEVLGIEDIAINDNFFDLGGNSLTAVCLVARIESIYKNKISVRTIFDNPTIEELTRFVRQKTALSSPSTVVPLRSRGSLRPFFCVHPAGGLANCYLPLARHLGSQVPFYGLQSHGLDDSQSPLRRIEEMASLYIKDLRRIQPHGPYQIGGWSLGGTVAFEMAQQLSAAGEEVALLALFDAEPGFDPIMLPITDEELLETEKSRVAELLIKDGITPEELAPLSFEQRLELFLDKYKQSGKMPADVTIGQCNRFLRVWATNQCAKRRYFYQPHSGRLTLFRSSLTANQDATYGWQNLAKRGVEVFQFPADHDEFMAEPNAQLLAEALRQHINQVSHSLDFAYNSVA